MKPLMILDARVAKTREVPVHPSTKDIWVERLDEMQWILMDLRYNSQEPEGREAKEKRYNELCVGVEWASEPNFYEQKILLGSNAVSAHGITITAEERAEMCDRKRIVCHPETWAQFTEDQKAKFELQEPIAYLCATPPAPA